MKPSLTENHNCIGIYYTHVGTETAIPPKTNLAAYNESLESHGLTYMKN